MKKWLMLALVAFSAAVAKGYSEEKTTELMKAKYARLGVATLPMGDKYATAPSVTFGRRALDNGSGIDISCGFSGIDLESSINDDDDYYDFDRDYAFSYSLPKVMYLSFSDPRAENGLYYGIGGSIGSVLSKSRNQRRDFTGLMANGSLGYTITKSKGLTGFSQLDCSYPVIAIYSKGERPNPVFELSFGLGF